MDYKKIVIDGYIEKEEQRTPYVSYFKREAQRAKDTYVEFADFFNGCKQTVKEYNNEINRQYGSELRSYHSTLSGTDRQGFLTPEDMLTLGALVCRVAQQPGKIARGHGSTLSLCYRDIEELGNAISQAEQELTPAAAVNPPQAAQLTIPDNILQALQQAGFIENAAARPLKWIAYNKRAKGETLNKKSLLDLLCLLGYPDHIIKDRNLLNSHFIFPNNQKLTAQNYTDITDTTKEKKLKRPIISEYHAELESIINQTGKEK